MIDGPGPPVTARCTGGPTGVLPTSFWALICTLDPERMAG